MVLRLKPFLTHKEAGESYQCAAGQLGTTEGAVKMAVHRMRRRFGELLREEIAHPVASAAEVEDEIRYLFSVIG